MFRGIRYVLSVNKALAELGFDCRTISPELRQGAQQNCFRLGYSAQETAAIIGIFLGPARKPPFFDLIVEGWVLERKMPRLGVLQTAINAMEITAGSKPMPAWLKDIL